MFKGAIEALRDYILRFNPYFRAGYTEVYQDGENGIIHNNMPIFPADNLGDYFYLRLPQNVTFQYGRVFDIADGIVGGGLVTNIILVACTQNGDEDKMITNLVNTLQAYQPGYITLNSVIYSKDDVLAQELAKIKPENISAALQRLDDDYAIVCVNFTYSQEFTFNEPSCITKPCKTC